MDEAAENTTRVNELSPELLALHSLNFAVANNAPARGTMFASHFAQRPVINGSEPALIQTGIAEEFGKYTFSTKMPEDGTILRIIPRYQIGVTDGDIPFNPETIVVYRSHETGVVDFFKLSYHHSNHSIFGFEYEKKEAAKYISYMAEFKKDTIFADSPAVKGESHYTFGRNLNIIYMSHPNVGLDGYVINRDALKHLKFKIYETRSINIGAGSIPLNLYGDDDNYKPFPEIGEYVRDDGLLMAKRPFNQILAPALFSTKDLQTIDYVFDKKIYSRPGKGRVVGLTVVRSDNVNRQLPSQMTKQLEKYAAANDRFHGEIVALEAQLIAESRRQGRNGEIDISPALQRLIVTARAIAHRNQGKTPLILTYKREPLDTWKLTFTIEYEITPDRGFKLTCDSGGMQFFKNTGMI